MRFGSKLGLERMSDLMRRLGDPQNKTKFIHVAGTNGKGSTVTMLYEVLRAAGYSVGKYTSPYVYEFEERIAVDGKLISKDVLAELTGRVADVCSQMVSDGWEHPTEFEVVTAIAFCYFAEMKCDFVVLEVGLGGRFDATNIIAAPLVAVITALSLDHTAILGDTILKITHEKCGIIKPGCRVVAYPLQQEGVIDYIASCCAERGCALTVPDTDKVNLLQSDLFGNRFAYKQNEYRQQLVGKYQIYNGITVIETVEQLRLAGIDISEQALYDGIAACKMFARFERVCDKPMIIMDAGHNPQGIDALTDLLDGVRLAPHIVFGVMRDKEYEYAISNLAKRALAFYAVAPAGNARALPPSQSAEIAKHYCKNVSAYSEITDALDAALQSAEDGLILICGSFYIMEEAKNVLKDKGIL